MARKKATSKKKTATKKKATSRGSARGSKTAAKRGAGKKKLVTSTKVNFKGVNRGAAKVADGQYLCECKGFTKEVGKESGEGYLKWRFEIQSEDKATNGKELTFTTSLQDNSLWNLAGLIEAMGGECPEKETTISSSDFEGEEIILLVENEEYEGRMQSKVTDYLPADSEEDPEVEDEEEEEAEEEEGEEEEEESEEELYTSEEIEEMDAEELETLAEELDLEVDIAGIRGKRKKQAAMLEALEEAELLADVEEEE